MIRFLVITILISTNSFGQFEVSGRVTTISNEPIAGVVITVRGKMIGTISNQIGYFKLTVPLDTAEVIFSFIGYKHQKVRVFESKTIDVKLVEEIIEDKPWNFTSERKLLSKKRNKTGTLYLYASEKVLLKNEKKYSKIVVWQFGKYKVYLPFDSLFNRLEKASYRPDDIEFGLDYLKHNAQRDTIFLSEAFVERVGEVPLNKLAIQMINKNSIAICNSKGVLLTFLIVRDVFRQEKKKKYDSEHTPGWGGVEFLANEKETPLFTITSFIVN